ncbi:MAG TPA: C25 family cysteine peptidase, partial [Chloroflexia bacterium]|nr:C25 family cysteine peptidase [Chloroflexia bacterium]
FEMVRARILAAVNAGPLLVNYLGHGNVDSWAAGLLTAADAPTLTNGGRLPLFVLMTCLNGYYPDPGLDSLGSALLAAENGGAVAVWASSGMNAPGAQVAVDRALVGHLFANPGLTLGDAVRLAKQATPDLNVRRTWILLGDPTLRLR